MAVKQDRFRAFDFFKNEYIFVGFHVVGEITCFGGMESHISETWKERREAKGYKCTIEAWNDFTFEQYIDREDINKRDVYEGDIVKVDIDDGSAATGIVEYDLDASAYKVLSEDGRSIYFMNVLRTEVIGNVHNVPIPERGY